MSEERRYRYTEPPREKVKGPDRPRDQRKRPTQKSPRSTSILSRTFDVKSSLATDLTDGLPGEAPAAALGEAEPGVPG